MPGQEPVDRAARQRVRLLAQRHRPWPDLGRAEPHLVEDRGEQAMLFLNRRGYAPLLLCRGCQHRWSCPQCSTYLVEHRQAGQWVCHLCGYHEPEPQDCPSCRSTDIARHGLGVEKVAEEAQALLPNARIRIATSDTVTTMALADQLVQEMLRG